MSRIAIQILNTNWILVENDFKEVTGNLFPF